MAVILDSEFRKSIPIFLECVLGWNFNTDEHMDGENICFLKNKYGGWGAGSVRRSSGCSSGGPDFSS